MTHAKHIAALAALLAFASAAFGAESQSPPAITIDADAGGLQTCTLGGRRFSFADGGGFRVFDATAQRALVLPHGTAGSAGVPPASTGSAGILPASKARLADKAFFACQGSEIGLHADFQMQGAYLLVSGYVENPRGDQRGWIVEYRLPLLSADAVFSNDLEQRLRLRSASEYEGNAFPIAAMCGKDRGLAVAIPPHEPRVFGMAGGSGGLSVRFYLGLSPEPRRFPNRASFVFLLYAVDPAWGFRSALSEYYAFFPECYTPRLTRDGLFMFQMKDRIPPNIDQYGFDLVETQWKCLDAALARDEKYGLATFPYMIVGQREIKFLPTLPKDYDEAMAVYAHWSLADQAGHAWTKENAASQGDSHLKEEVEASACQTADGRYSLVIRTTPWGGNSVSFKLNPNPDLFRDQGRATVASYALALQERWLKEHAEYDGLFVDSLGANWPALLNYRQDHFAYARFPLTFDPQGRVALQNELSHYEYLATLYARMRPLGKLLFANGVYAYTSKGDPAKPRPAARTKAGAGSRVAAQANAAAAAESPAAKPVERQVLDPQLHEFRQEAAPPEHYRAGTKLGRFFCSALLDVASSEIGVRATVERCQDVRVFMGKKHYAFLNYAWDDAAKVEEFINKSLCYGIFASTSANFFTGVPYENHPHGYLRDKKLLDWFVPLVRTLSRAGWEPVRYATVEPGDVSCERFGHGDVVYFTLYNDANSNVACTLSIDIRALGFQPEAVVLREIGRSTPLAQPAAGAIALELAPKRTYVIQATASKVNNAGSPAR